MQKIKLTIANRVYPLSVFSNEEEEVLRKAVKKIESMIQHFEKNYAVNDKQDVLAMCALQFASKLEVTSINENENIQTAETKLNQLHQLLDAYLN